LAITPYFEDLEALERERLERERLDAQGPKTVSATISNAPAQKPGGLSEAALRELSGETVAPPVQATVGLASKALPGVRTEALQVAQRLGVHPELVERNLEHYRALDKEARVDVQALSSSAPKTSEWMVTKHYDYAAAQQEIERLVGLEHAITFGGSILRGVDNVQSLWGRSMQWAGEVSGIDGLKLYGREVAEFNEGQADALGYRMTMADIDSPLRFVQWATSALGEQIPIMVPLVVGGAAGGVVGAAAGMARLGSAIGALVPSAVFGIGEAEAGVKAVDPELESPFEVFIGGSAIAALDSALPGHIGSRLVSTFGRETAETIAKRTLLAPVQPRFLRVTAKGTATSMSAEFITETMQGVIGQMTTNEVTLRGDNIDWLQALEEGATGALVGGTIGFSTEAGTFHRQRARFAEAKQLQATYQALADFGGTKFAQSLPANAQQFVSHLTQGTPLETLYVEPEVFQKYFQSRDVNAGIVAAELTGNVTALEDALASGAPLAIPTAAYAAKLAGTEHHAFFAQELRPRADGKNAREIAVARKVFEDEMTGFQAELADVVAHGVKPETRESPVFQALVQQLLAAPQFHAMVGRAKVDAVVVAEAYAASTAAVINTLAARAGEDPVALYAEQRLRIGRDGTNAAINAILAARAAASETQEGAQALAGEALETGEGVEPGETLTLNQEGLEDEDSDSDEDEDDVEVDEDGNPVKPPKKEPDVPRMQRGPSSVDALGRVRPSSRMPTAMSAPAITTGPLRTDWSVVQSVPPPKPPPKNRKPRKDGKPHPPQYSLVQKFMLKLRAYGLLKQDEGSKRAVSTHKRAEAVGRIFIDRVKVNLRFLYDLMLPEHRERAKLWYVGAHRIMQDLADEFGVSEQQVAGVLAALSPQMDWFKNVSLARRVLTIYALAQKENRAFTPELMQHYIARASHSKETTTYPKVYRDTIAKRISQGMSVEDAKANAQMKVDAERAKDERIRARRKAKYEGRRWADLDAMGRAYLLRQIDETEFSPNYNIILPEGEQGELVYNKAQGKAAPVASKVGWGTYAFIRDAVSILEDGSQENIDRRIGDKHKVRSFYGNINDPWNPNLVTIDTHAIAAALMEALAGSDPPAKLAMGGLSHSMTGIQGTNAIYAQAYFELADELSAQEGRPMLAREVQSIVWEAVRGLFPAEEKKGALKSFQQDISGIWAQFRSGKISHEQALVDILARALRDHDGVLPAPDWADHPPRTPFDESGLRAGTTRGFERRPAGVPAGRRAPGLRAGGPAGEDAGVVGRHRGRYNQGGRGAGSSVVSIGDRRATITRALSALRDASTQPYERVSDSSPEGLGRVTYRPITQWRDALTSSRFAAQDIVELPRTRESAEQFHARITALKQANPHGAAVYVYPIEDYEQMRLFVTADGAAIAALKSDGDMVSLASSGGGQVYGMMSLLIQEGGTKNDNFDTALVDMYSSMGMRVVERVPWNEEYKPEGWDYETFKAYTNGRPDVVYMEFAPAVLKTGPLTLNQSTIETGATSAQVFSSRLQRAAQDAKVNKASGRDWKAIIKGAKTGVNTEEFLLSDVDALDDTRSYTKTEVLEYLRANEAAVAWRILSTPSANDVRKRAEQMRDEEIEKVISATMRSSEDMRQAVLKLNTPAEFNGGALTEDERWELYAAKVRENNADMNYWLPKAEHDLSKEREFTGSKALFTFHVLPGEVEDGSHREVFLQARNNIGGYAALTVEENRTLSRMPFAKALRSTLRQAASPLKLTTYTVEDTFAQYLSLLRGEKGVTLGARPYQPTELERTEMPEYERIIAKLRDSQDYRYSEKGGWRDGHEDYSHIESPIVRLRFNIRRMADGRRVLFVDELQPPQDKPTDEETGEDGEPIGPSNFSRMPELFQKNWRELGMKFALRYAAEQGLAGVMLTNGAQQAKRSGLMAVVETMNWKRGPHQFDYSDYSGKFTLNLTGVTVVPKDQPGRRIRLFVRDDGRVARAEGIAVAQNTPFAQVVGKEMAEKILSEPTGSLSGEALEIGNSAGLKRLYDEDIPNVINKLPAVKQAGGKVRMETLHRLALDTTPVSEVPLQPFIEMTPELSSAVLGGQHLFQKTDEPTAPPRGEIVFDDQGVKIEWLEEGDLSTFLHETAHLYLQMLGDLSDKLGQRDPATLTESQRTLIADHEAVLKYLGVTHRSQIGTKEHEVFARSFEAYLRLGRAPSVTLRSVFARYRSWLTRLYKMVAQLNVNLNDEIVDVFDRLVASDEELALARGEARAVALFVSPDQIGMTAFEWQAYQRTIREAHEAQEESLVARVMGELQRESQAWWKDRKAELRGLVETEKRNEPAYRALFLLQRGEGPDGQPFEGAFKLSKASIAEAFGESRLKKLPKPWVYTVDGGMTVEAAAELLGFENGDALLTALETVEPFDEAVTRDVDAKMKAQYGDMRLDGTMRLEARRAVLEHGTDHILAAELEALGRVATPANATDSLLRVPSQAQPFVTAARAQDRAVDASGRRALRRRLQETQVDTDALRATALAQVERLTPNKLQVGGLWRAFLTAGSEAAKALLAGRYEDAVTQKNRQRMALALHRATVEAADEADSIAKLARRLGEAPAQARLGLAGHGFQDAVNTLLEKYEFVTQTKRELARRQSLVEWVMARERETGESLDHVPAAVLDAARQTNYREVPMSELRQVRDALKAIDHLARRWNKVYDSQDKRSFDERKDAMVASIRERNKTRPARLEFKRSDKLRDHVYDFFASHRKIADIAQGLDGYLDGGLVHRYLVRPLSEAADRQAQRMLAEGKRYNDIIKEHYPGRELGKWHVKTVIPGVGALSKEAALSVALNFGNATSRDRILSDANRKWTPVQVQSILDSLDARDLAFVQDTFDYVESFWSEIAEASFRRTGLRPEKVLPVAITAKAGTIRGGYYPLAYDGRLSGDAAANAVATVAKLEMAGAYLRTTTARGHEMTRLEHVESSVKLELGVLFSHIDQVVHDLTHADALSDVSRLLRHKDVKSALYDTIGAVGFKQFASIVSDVAIGNAGSATATDNFIDKSAAYVKTGTQVAALGFAMWTAAQQPLGLFNGSARVGPTWVLRGMRRWLTDAATMENTLVWIREVSPFMATRATTQNQDINDLRNRLSEPGGWFDTLVRSVSANRATQQNVTDAFLWHIGLMQRVADVPTWLGQYEKARAAGASEVDAAAQADTAVRDSQGGGQTIDLSKVQRLGPVARLFMVFYSYGSTVYGQTARATGKFSRDTSAAGLAKFLGELSLIYLFPSVATVVLSRLLRGRDEDDEEGEEVAVFLEDMARETASSALNTMVLVRELSPFVKGQTWQGYQGPAGLRIGKEVFSLGNQLLQGEVDEGLWKSLNAVGGILFRYPSNQMQRTIDGWVALQDGTTERPTALLFGPPRKQ